MDSETNVDSSRPVTRAARCQGSQVAAKRIGKQPPRYAFLLNAHDGERLSRCPTCRRPTHRRKFVLFIHAEGWGPVALGKTCRYCTPCEMIIAHKHELDAEMARTLAQIAPEAVGQEYFVLGTVDRKVWQQGLQGAMPSLKESLDHVAGFKTYLGLEVERGGWRRAERS